MCWFCMVLVVTEPRIHIKARGYFLLFDHLPRDVHHSRKAPHGQHTALVESRSHFALAASH